MNEGLHIICPQCNTINRLPKSRLEEHPKCGKCQSALFNGLPTVLNKDNFDHYLKNNSIPILVDFWASWCGPCKMMAPHFESAAKILEPKVRLAKVNTETEQILASRYSVQSIPMLILFHQGKEIARNAGVMVSRDLVNWVNRQL